MVQTNGNRIYSPIESDYSTKKPWKSHLLTSDEASEMVFKNKMNFKHCHEVHVDSGTEHPCFCKQSADLLQRARYFTIFICIFYLKTYFIVI